MSDKVLYQKEFEAFLKARSFEPAWLQTLRKTAFQQFVEQGLPSTKHEDWKYTKATRFTDNPFQFAEQAPNWDEDQVNTLAGPSLTKHRLVFVDGHFIAALSKTGELPKGSTLSSMTTAIKNNDENLQRQLQRQLDQVHERPFAALNLAFFTDGAWLHLSNGAVVEEPIQVIFASSAQTTTVSHPRNVIVAHPNSQATLIETFVGQEGGYWTNCAFDIEVHNNAQVTHYKVQKEDANALHLSNLSAHIHRDSRFANHIISFGAKLTRNDSEAAFNAEGGECTLNGLYLANDQQHVDNRTFLDHAKPHCNSFEVYKGILDGKGTGVFNGKILVRQDAQKTDAKQSNQALLLSDDATIYSKPQLEIFADDVKCTHGATSGNLDPESMFYLRARGIPEKRARRLLTYAFANDLLTQIAFEPLRDQLEKELNTRLQQHERSTLL